MKDTHDTKVLAKQDETLNPLYEEFLAFKTKRVKASTMNTLTRKFHNFPTDPHDLNAGFLEKRLSRVPKSLSVATIHFEHTIAKTFCKWAIKNNHTEFETILEGLEAFDLPKRGRTTVTIEDLYTKEELDALIRVADSVRDHAIIQVLYESACRASEFLSMTFENIKFDNDKGIAIVNGKTGTREIYLKDSVPSFRAWLNMHPTKTGQLWVASRVTYDKDKNPTYTTLTRSGLDLLIRRCLKRAGIKDKKKVLHMFRHTRATELVRRGVRGQMLNKFMGWTPGSNMEQVYVHLSTDDVKNEIYAKIFGDVEDVQPDPLLTSGICPNCETPYPQGAVICEKCNLPLSNDEIVRALTEKDSLEKQVADLQQNILTMGLAINNIMTHLAFMPEDELREGMAVTRDFTSMLTLVRVQDMLANTPKDELQKRIDAFNVEQEKEGKTKIDLAYWEGQLAGAPKIELQQILQNTPAIIDMIRAEREKENKKPPKKQSKKKKPTKKQPKKTK